MKNALILSAILLAPALCAQATQTLLHPLQAVPLGNSNNNIPFSWYPTRYQQVLNYEGFNASTPLVMNSVSMRMASGFGTGNYGGHTVTLSTWLSATPSGINSTNASTNFASNQDAGTLSQVMSQVQINLPKLSHNNFAIKLPFSKPWVYTGAATKRNVCLEVRTYSNSNANGIFTYPLDVYTGAMSGTAVTNGTFTGCRAPSATSTPTNNAVTSRLKVGNTQNYFYGNSYVANAPGIFILGASPLNINLPGGCVLTQDLVLTLTATAQNTTTGRTDYPFPIPADPRLKGVSFYTQLWWYVPGANALNLIASRGLLCQLATQDDIDVSARIYSYTDANGLPDTFTDGSKGSAYGLVLEFSN